MTNYHIQPAMTNKELQQALGEVHDALDQARARVGELLKRLMIEEVTAELWGKQ
jgi:hypothetical protein